MTAVVASIAVMIALVVTSVTTNSKAPTGAFFIILTPYLIVNQNISS
jgi:hypothetical protein